MSLHINETKSKNVMIFDITIISTRLYTYIRTTVKISCKGFSMDNSGRSEHIIEDLGCGRFQVILFVSVMIFTATSVAFTNQLMSFGNYNPGWRCLDNDTIHVDMTRHTRGHFTVINDTLGINNNVTSHQYSVGECSVFESCQHVEFNPEASTIVTEWGLVCSKAWIPSLMISLQMFGFLIGAVLAGTAGDIFGRKFIIYLSTTCTMIFNTIAIFSNSWQMFAALRLLLGISMSFIATIYIVYMGEFVTKKFRAIVLGCPSYAITAVMFGIVCLLSKDWRQIQIITTVTGVVGLIPAFWLPESLRWLEVKNKADAFQNAAKKIAKTNGKILYNVEPLQNETKTEMNKLSIKAELHNILQIFRKEHKRYTLIVTLPWFSVSLIYYAIAFGIKGMSGNFYLNLILFYAVEICVDIILMFAPNLIGRKNAGVAFCGLSGICLLVAACFQEVVSGNSRIYGVTVPANIGRISISAFWSVMQVFMVELYPTVVRGAANSWGLVMARAGGIMAPILIPTETSTVFICYAVMGALGVLCALLVLLLPETKGKALQDNFKEKVFDENETDNEVL